MLVKSSDHLDCLRDSELLIIAVAVCKGGAIGQVQVGLSQPLLEVHNLRYLLVMNPQSLILFNPL